jgi:hypothetical protein
VRLDESHDNPTSYRLAVVPGAAAGFDHNTTPI